MYVNVCMNCITFTTETQWRKQDFCLGAHRGAEGAASRGAIGAEGRGAEGADGSGVRGGGVENI